MIDGEKIVTESEAIMIYLVHKGGRKELLGRNVDEQVWLATAYGVYKDFHALYIKLCYGGHGMESYESAHKDYVPKFRVSMEKLSGMLS